MIGLGWNPLDWISPTVGRVESAFGMYPSVNPNLVLPTPVSPHIQPPAGALDYLPGGSSTSVYLDPNTTVPDYQAAAQQTMDAAAAAIAADNAARNPPSAIPWIIAGVVAIGVFAVAKR